MGSKRSRRSDDSSSISQDESNLELGESEMESAESDMEIGESDMESGESEDAEENVEQNGKQRDDEMEELEKEYSNLRHQEQDLLKNLMRHKDEDILKGQSVKNQKVLWDKTLELRCLLQKSFSSSNKLPQGLLRSLFCTSDKAIDKAYSELIDSSKKTLNCLLELQEALLEKNPTITATQNGATKESSTGQNASNNSDEETDEEWVQIHKLHSSIAPYRDSSVDKWQRKTQVATGAAALKGKLHAFNQNISQQVATYMKDPSKIIKRMQLRRSTVGILGQVPEEVNNISKENADVDGDPELLDDSEFYQQLLKEFIDSFDPTSSDSIYALKRMQPKKRKLVDRRASKSRKIRYHVHEKLVSFMAPEPMNVPDMAPKLFQNLFGLKTHKSASVA